MARYLRCSQFITMFEFASRCIVNAVSVAGGHHAGIDQANGQSEISLGEERHAYGGGYVVWAGESDGIRGPADHGNFSKGWSCKKH